MSAQSSMSGQRRQAPQRAAIQFRRMASRPLRDIAIDRSSALVRFRQDIESASFANSPRCGNCSTSAAGSRRFGRVVNVWAGRMSSWGSNGSHRRVTSNGYSLKSMPPQAGVHQVPRPCTPLNSASRRRTQVAAIREDLANSRLPRARRSNDTICRTFSWSSTTRSKASKNRVRTAGASAAAIAQVTIPSASHTGSCFGKPFPFPLWLSTECPFNLDETRAKLGLPPRQLNAMRVGGLTLFQSGQAAQFRISSCARSERAISTERQRANAGYSFINTLDVSAGRSEQRSSRLKVLQLHPFNRCREASAGAPQGAISSLLRHVPRSTAAFVMPPL